VLRSRGGRLDTACSGTAHQGSAGGPAGSAGGPELWTNRRLMPALACAGGEGNRRLLLNCMQLLEMHQLNWACSLSKLLKKLSPGYFRQL